MGFDWKSLVKSVAPTIATALGGPFAGYGVRALSSALLGKEDGKEDEIAAALAGADPEMLLKMKQAEQSFKVTMKELDIKMEDIEARDRASARERQMALGDVTPAVLAYILTVGIFLVILGLFKYAIPEVNQSTIYILIGALGTAWVSAMQYFHGSSSGSKRKDVLMRGNNN